MNQLLDYAATVPVPPLPDGEADQLEAVQLAAGEMHLIRYGREPFGGLLSSSGTARHNPS